MDWRGDYQRKLTTAEEAVKVVKSGDRLAIRPGRHRQRPKRGDLN